MLNPYPKQLWQLNLWTKPILIQTLQHPLSQTIMNIISQKEIYLSKLTILSFPYTPSSSYANQLFGEMSLGPLIKDELQQTR